MTMLNYQTRETANQDASYQTMLDYRTSEVVTQSAGTISWGLNIAMRGIQCLLGGLHSRVMHLDAPEVMRGPQPVMESGEGNLIAEAASGKTAAFEKLTAPLADSLYSIIAGIAGQTDAEDVLQETLLNAYKGMGNFRGDCAFSTWMTRIAVNAARSWLRKKRPEVAPATSSDGEEDCPADPFDAMASPSPGPAEVLAMQEDKERVGEALTKLPDEEREVLVMREVDGMKYSAIADALEITEGAVRARLHRARNRMFSLLGGLSATSRSATSPSATSSGPSGSGPSGSRPSGSRPSGRTQ